MCIVKRAKASRKQPLLQLAFPPDWYAIRPIFDNKIGKGYTRSRHDYEFYIRIRQITSGFFMDFGAKVIVR
jgi:hypothetical protein